jgi:hypothetical protein
MCKKAPREYGANDIPFLAALSTQVGFYDGDFD